MGGEVRTWPRTVWPELDADFVCRRYWKPVYCYLRQKGNDNEKAKDLTQGFFVLLLERDLAQRADPAKGRFRTFLLTALDRYVRNVHRDAKAKKRAPTGRILPLDDSRMTDVPDPVAGAGPAVAFHYAWASELLDQVFHEVERACRAAGLAVHWDLFRARVLAPILDGYKAPSLADLCRKYGISGEAKASNMIVTVKRRLKKVLSTIVQEEVGPGIDVNEEIGDLRRILSQRRAGR